MEEKSENKIIEINGIKFEVDARTATLRQLSTIRIGAKVKVLKDERVCYGVVIGFEPFAENPVVIICYIDTSYYSSTADFKFLYFSSKSKEQIVVSSEDDDVGIERDDIVLKMDKEIAKKTAEIQDIEDKKQYFLKKFGAYWDAFKISEAQKAE